MAPLSMSELGLANCALLAALNVSQRPEHSPSFRKRELTLEREVDAGEPGPTQDIAFRVAIIAERWRREGLRSSGNESTASLAGGTIEPAIDMAI